MAAKSIGPLTPIATTAAATVARAVIERIFRRPAAPGSLQWRSFAETEVRLAIEALRSRSWRIGRQWSVIRRRGSIWMTPNSGTRLVRHDDSRLASNERGRLQSRTSRPRLPDTRQACLGRFRRVPRLCHHGRPTARANRQGGHACACGSGPSGRGGGATGARRWRADIAPALALRPTDQR
jgi:hypothetical protein